MLARLSIVSPADGSSAWKLLQLLNGKARRTARARDGVNRRLCASGGHHRRNHRRGEHDESRRLGPGVFESVYETVLYAKLQRRGLHVERQRLVGFMFDDIRFDQAFRIDLLVERSVIVEVKSLDKVAAVHRKQVLTYLRLMNLRVGLLLNFGAETMKEGITRVTNDQ